MVAAGIGWFEEVDSIFDTATNYLWKAYISFQESSALGCREVPGCELIGLSSGVRRGSDYIETSSSHCTMS